MKLKTIPYKDYEKNLPQEGKHILSQTIEDSIIVYQAYRPSIAKYAVNQQKFGGSDYSFDRMSWIKPNFLWMMYRSGWATKPGQEKILAIELSFTGFQRLLEQAVHSSFKENIYSTREAWRDRLKSSEVRLQWDPDHDPYGDKLTRKAIQLGLRGNTLREFNDHYIRSIADITDFVRGEKIKLATGRIDDLLVLEESVVNIENDLNLTPQCIAEIMAKA